jgi:hypothetical protein
MISMDLNDENKRISPRIMALLKGGSKPETEPKGLSPKVMSLLKESIDHPDRTAMGTLGDVAVTGAKAVVGVGESAVGLADIPTLGLPGKALEYLGWDPEKTHEVLGSLYSPAQKAANLRVQEAKGFVGSVKAAIANPSTIAHATLESLPLMFGGAGLARFGLSKAPALLKAYPKLAPLVAGAMGEGLVSMGMAAEQTRQETPDGLLTPKQAAISLASGFGTAAIALAGGRVAMKLGLTDVDTLLAGGRGMVGPKGVIKRILGGGISEGVFEELPQSMQEQIWSNAAMDRPLLQGVSEAGAQGMLAGALMGAGAGIVPGGPDISGAETPGIGDPSYTPPTGDEEDVTTPPAKSLSLEDQLNAWDQSREDDPLGDDDRAKDIIESVGGALEPESLESEADVQELSAFEALKAQLEGRKGQAVIKPEHEWQVNEDAESGGAYMVLGDPLEPVAVVNRSIDNDGKELFRGYVRVDGGLESLGITSSLEQTTTAIQEELGWAVPPGPAPKAKPKTEEAKPAAVIEPTEKKPPTTDELRAKKQLKKDKYAKERSKKAAKAKTVRSFLGYMGGVNPDDPVFSGELADIRWDTNAKGKKVPAKGFPVGFWNKKGLSLDERVTDLIEAGWLPPGSTDNDLLKAIEGNLDTRHIKAEDAYTAEVDKKAAELIEGEKPPKKPAFPEMVKAAQEWKGAAINADKLYSSEDKKARLAHSEMTTKGDLDAYLIKKFGLDAQTARTISNQLTFKNLPALEYAKVMDYEGEPWADAALKIHAKAREEQKAKPKPESEGVTYYEAEELADQGYESLVTREGYDTDADAAQLMGVMKNRYPGTPIKMVRHSDGTLSAWANINLPDQRPGQKKWQNLEVGDVFHDEVNNRDLKVHGKGMTPKSKAETLAEGVNGEVWIDAKNKWAVVVEVKDVHALAFMKGLKSKELLDKSYHDQFKQITDRTDIKADVKTKMLAEVSDAYEVESKKFPTEKPVKPKELEPQQVSLLLNEGDKVEFGRPRIDLKPLKGTITKVVGNSYRVQGDNGLQYEIFPEEGHTIEKIEAPFEKPGKEPGKDFENLFIDMADQKEVEGALNTWVETGDLPPSWISRVDKPWQIRREHGGYVGEINETHTLAKKFLEDLKEQNKQPKTPEQVAVPDDWKGNLIKARKYALDLGIATQKGIGEHWTDHAVLVKGIEDSLASIKPVNLKEEKPAKAEEPKKASEMSAGEMMAEWDKQASEQEEATEQIQQLFDEGVKPTAKGKAGEAKQHLKNAADKFKQINDILGKEGAVGGLDEGKWGQIRPLLMEALSDVLAAGKSGAEFVALSIKGLSPAGRPYFERFVQEEIEGKKKEEVKPKRENPRTAAIGAITLGKVDQAEAQGWQFGWADEIGELSKNNRIELSGPLSGGKVDQLIEAGLSAKMSRKAYPVVTSRPGTPDQLKKIDVHRQVVNEKGMKVFDNKGKPYIEVESAFDALNDIDSRIDIYKEMIHCL